jgi:Spy/CpxP family protein refolding chaperone
MKTFAAASLAIVLAFAGGTALACGHGGDGAKDPEKHLERMTEKLGLSPEQRDKVKVLMDQHHAKRDAQREAMQAEMRASMANVLTPEQMTKLDEMHEARKERKEMRKERKEDRKAEREARREGGGKE